MHELSSVCVCYCGPFFHEVGYLSLLGWSRRDLFSCWGYSPPGGGNWWNTSPHLKGEEGRVGNVCMPLGNLQWVAHRICTDHLWVDKGELSLFYHIFTAYLLSGSLPGPVSSLCASSLRSEGSRAPCFIASTVSQDGYEHLWLVFIKY